MSDVKDLAQKQAEEAYILFILWSKRITIAAILGLLFVASCNFGVDSTGSAYNGEQIYTE